MPITMSTAVIVATARTTQREVYLTASPSFREVVFHRRQPVIDGIDRHEEIVDAPVFVGTGRDLPVELFAELAQLQKITIPVRPDVDRALHGPIGRSQRKR